MFSIKAIHFSFKITNSIAKYDWKQEFLEMEQQVVVRLEVDHFDQKISMRTEAFHLFVDWNSENVGIQVKWQAPTKNLTKKLTVSEIFFV